jgi:predicted transcriptional regulator
MIDNDKKVRQIILTYFRNLKGWCGMKTILESISEKKENVLKIVHELVEKGIIIREWDVNTKKAWYHLADKSIK